MFYILRYFLYLQIKTKQFQTFFLVYFGYIMMIIINE